LNIHFIFHFIFRVRRYLLLFILPLFILFTCIWIKSEFSKYENRLPLKIISKTVMRSTASIYKQSRVHFCKTVLKARLSSELHLYIPRALALSQNSSKLENAFALRLVRSASRFTLNPVRKRSARPSISKVRRDERMQLRCCEFPHVDGKSLSFSLSLSLSLFLQRQLER